jgi:hypothetical protein
MPQSLKNYSSAELIGNTNKSLHMAATNGPLPACQVAFAVGAALQPYGIVYWAARVIALTRDDWVKHGCFYHKEKRGAAAGWKKPTVCPVRSHDVGHAASFDYARHGYGNRPRGGCDRAY